MNDCCLTQVGSGFDGICGIPLPKHPFSDPPGIQTFNAVFIGSHFTVISHSVWLSLKTSWKFSSSFHNQRKKRCKPSSLDILNAHLRERSQYGLQINVFEERRMLPRTEIIVSENFNPTLGTMGQFFLARSGDASRSAAGRAHEKALTPRAILIRTRSRNLEIVSEVLFCGFPSVSESRSERLLPKSQALKQGFRRSLSVLLTTPSLWVLTIRLKRTQI